MMFVTCADARFWNDVSESKAMAFMAIYVTQSENDTGQNAEFAKVGAKTAKPIIVMVGSCVVGSCVDLYP